MTGAPLDDELVWVRRVLTVLNCNTPEELERWTEAARETDAITSAMRLREFAELRATENWLPLLQTFAASCRRQRGRSGCDSLDRAQAEQRRILRELMEQRRRTLPSVEPPAGRAALAITEWFAIPDLEEIFDPSESVVCLTPSEQRQWNQNIYDHRIENELGYWWCDQHAWTITSTPISEEGLSDAPTPIRESSGFWIVSESHASGSLCGGGGSTIWTWDGSRARFHSEGSLWMS